MKQLKKKIISILLALAMVIGMLPLSMTEAQAFTGTWADNTTVSSFAGGDGSQASPYQIATAGQLAYLARLVNSGTDTSGKYYELTANIDVSANVWEPIGYYSKIPEINNSFKGNFNGNGHCITGVHFGGGYTSPNPNYVNGGLFGQTSGAVIQNLGVSTTGTGQGMSLEGKNSSYLGALVGYAENSTITNCYSTGNQPVTLGHDTSLAGTASQKPAVGGLVGVAASGSTIDRCYSDVKVLVDYYADAGGLVGRISSTTVKNSYSVSSDMSATQAVVVYPDIVTGSQEPHIGGLVGDCISTGNRIVNCYTTRTISSPAGSGGALPTFPIRIGGLVGYQDVWATGIENCYAAGYISSSNPRANEIRGSLVGENQAKIYNSYCIYGIDPCGTSYAGLSGAVQFSDAEMKGGATSIQWYSAYTNDTTKTVGGTVASVIDALNLGRAATGIACYGWKADSTSANNGYPVFDTGSASSISLKNKTVPYSGTAVTYTSADIASLSGSGGTVSYKYYSDAGCSTEIAAPSNAGTYYVKATVAADSLYNSATSAAATLTISSVPVTGITGVPTAMTAGTPLALSGTVNPGTATNKTIVWSVKNAGTTNATISGSTLSAVSAGTVTVTATITNGTAVGTNYTQDFNITVNMPFVPITSINGVPTAMTAGTPLALTGTVNPGTATNKTIVWSVKNAGTTNATISGSTLSAVSAGTVTVTATITNGTAVGANYTQDFNITVNMPFVPVTSITGVPTAMTAGTPLALFGTVNPGTATNNTISWDIKSDSGTGASLSGNTLSASAAGTVTVTATIADGTAVGTNYTKDFSIAVSMPFVPVTDITGVPTAMTAGTPLTLTATVNPGTATNQTINWSLTNAGGTGANISGNSLTAASAGTVTVMATIDDGTAVGSDYAKIFTIVVNAAFVPVTDITGVPTAMTAGTPLTLSGTVAPSSATNKTIDWSVKAAGGTGATISGSTLSASAAGSVTVTATITNGTAVGTNYTQDFTITVSNAFVPVTSITGVPTAMTAGSPLVLSGTVNPGTATNNTISWGIKSDSGTGASLSGSTLSASAAGSVTVTATITNGTAVGTNYEQDFTITVSTAPPTPKTLTSVNAPTAITGLPNGTAKTAVALGLPSTVTLATDNGNVSASVTWDVASCSYNAASTSVQIFIVSGSITLPAGVINPSSISTGTSISVTVNAASTPSTPTGGGGGGGSGTPTTSGSSAPKVTVDGGTVTAAQTVSATTGSDGTATASVTKDQIAGMVKAAGEKAQGLNTQTSLEIKVDSGNAATGVSVTINQGAISALTNGVSALTVSSPVVTVTFDDKALDAINKNAAGDIIVTARKPADTSLSDKDKAIIGNRPVYDLIVSNGGTAISTFGGGTATVSVPYKPAAGEDVNKIVVYYISGSGKLIVVPDCVYDASSGTVTFKTTHFSSYAVAYNNVSFTDVSGWYADYVSYLAARGIINGAGDGKFGPGNNITRAEFVTILAKLSGNDLSSYTTSSFGDVTANAWYSAAVQWAYEKGIASGYNGNFGPNAKITREQMASMLYNYAKYMGIDVSSEGMSLKNFSDAASISKWAAGPVQWAVSSGIVSGNGNGSFAPKAYATRGQTAKMIAVLMQGTIK